MKKIANYALILFLVLFAVGCAFLTPKTADLENVHQLYRQEFSSSVIPATPNNQKDAACQNNDEAFVQTLRAIRDYQIKYPQTDARIVRHLYVLQAMVYLQSGRPGMARLLQKEYLAKDQNVKQQKTGYPRDALFAANLEFLIDGWIAYCMLDKDGGPFQPKKFAAQEQTLRTAANEIQSNLQSFEITDPATDEGAIYIAASAAMFQMWASKIKGDRCFFGKKCMELGLSKEDLDRQCPNDQKCKREKRREEIKKMKTTEFAPYRTLLGPFLSDPEKQAAEAGEMQALPAGRLRYLGLYKYLGQ
jgi:hypothetical protein